MQQALNADDLNQMDEEFRASWDTVEEFYSQRLAEYPESLVIHTANLIKELRLAFYDDWFCASRIIYSLRLLRNRQSLWIHFMQNDGETMKVEAHINEKTYIIDRHPIRLSTELKALLEMLMSQPMDYGLFK